MPSNTPEARLYVSKRLTGIAYGGNDPDDNSGVLEYVRVWYGGRSIGQDNEINGITLAGVGRGTVVKYCEVAYNLDDGFEMFGGTVDLKYCSVIGVGDDAYDVDQGYQGRGQFLFAKVLKDDGNRAYEMDNKTNGNLDSSPRSHPVFYNATLVGPGGDVVSNNDQMARLREGVGGEFGNHIVYNGKEYGVSDRMIVDLKTSVSDNSNFRLDNPYQVSFIGKNDIWGYDNGHREIS